MEIVGLVNTILASQFMLVLAKTLLHFAWQGVAIAAPVYLLLRVIDGQHARLRYWVSLVALVLCLLVPAVNFVLLSDPQQGASVMGPNDVVTVMSAAPTAIEPAQSGIMQEILPLLSMSWLLAISFLSIKLMWQIHQVKELGSQGVAQPDQVLLQRFERLRLTLKANPATRLVLSISVYVPMVIGCFKPVVLLPISMATHLTSEQLEMLLAHELAHVKRHDYVVNILQSMIEILLFFHPCVRWISKQVRVEREYCCDDLAIDITGCSTAYARALTEAESVRRDTIPNLAMAATGGDLKKRVVRALQQHECLPRYRESWLGAFIVMSGITAATALFSLPNFADETGSKTPSRVDVRRAVGLETSADTTTELSSLEQFEVSAQALDLHVGVSVTTTQSGEPQALVLASRQHAKPIIEETVDVETVATPALSENTGVAITVSDVDVQVDVTADVSDESLSLAEDAITVTTAEAPVTMEATVAQPMIDVAESKTIEREQPAHIDVADASHIEPERLMAETFTDDVSETVAEPPKPEIVWPKALHSFAPRYPNMAQRKGIEAEVEVSFLVDLNGRVKDIEFSGDVHRIFKRAVANGLKQWRFEPGREDNQPVAMRLTKLFSFTNPVEPRQYTGSRLLVSR